MRPRPRPVRELQEAIHIVPDGSSFAHVASRLCPCGVIGGYVGIGSGRPVLRHRDPVHEPRVRIEPAERRASGPTVTPAMSAVRELYVAGVTSRAELAARLGKSPAAVKALVARLNQMGALAPEEKTL